MHLLSLSNAFRARLASKLQHHFQCDLHCGNDPTVANHNGILSTAHARKTLETHLQCGTDPDPNMIRAPTKTGSRRQSEKKDDFEARARLAFKKIFRRKITSAKMEKIC